MVERELSKADMESEEAMKALSERLDNKPSVVSNASLSCSAQPDACDSIESLTDSASRKRPAQVLELGSFKNLILCTEKTWEEKAKEKIRMSLRTCTSG